MASAGQRTTGSTLLVAGAVLMTLAWRWRAAGGLAVVEAAVAGPLSVALGAGVLIHGERIPRYGMSRLTRVYGVAGGLAGALYLFLIGLFAETPPGRARWLLPLLVTGIWLIPGPAPPEPRSRA